MEEISDNAFISKLNEIKLSYPEDEEKEITPTLILKQADEYLSE